MQTEDNVIEIALELRTSDDHGMIAAEVLLDRGLQPRRRHVQFDRPAGKPPPQPERGKGRANDANHGAEEEPPHKARAKQIVGRAA